MPGGRPWNVAWLVSKGLLFYEGWSAACGKRTNSITIEVSPSPRITVNAANSCIILNASSEAVLVGLECDTRK